MAMTTHAVGFRPPDDEWRKMKAAWEACEAVGALIPNAVLAFFDHEDPEDKPGQEINIDQAVSHWSNEYSCNGYEIDVQKLPPGVKIIRIYNSY